MSHHQLTPFETALLRAVDDLNKTFETGLKSAGASPNELANLQREFERFANELATRLSALEQQQGELRQQLRTG